MADRLTQTRDLAIMARYVFHEILARNPTFTQVQFGQELGSAPSIQAIHGKFQNKFLDADGTYVSKLLSGRQWAGKADIPAIPLALDHLMEKRKIPKISFDTIPPSFYVTYRRYIEGAFGDFANYIPQVNTRLRDLADVLPGIWRFFYLSPDATSGAPTFVSNVTFFFPAEDTDLRAYGMAIGPKNDRWLVSGWRAERRKIFLSWQDPKTPYSALMIAMSPSLDSPITMGIATFLLPNEGGDERSLPALSVFFFGLRQTLETYGIGATFRRPNLQNPEDNNLHSTVALALAGGHLTQKQQDDLASAFRVSDISLDNLRDHFSPLVDYLLSHRQSDFRLGSADPAAVLNRALIGSR